MRPILIAIDLRPLLTDFESGVTVYAKAIVRELQKIPWVSVDLFYQAGKREERIHAIFPHVRHIKMSNTVFNFRWFFGLRNLPKSYFLKKPDLIWMPDRRQFYSTDIPVFMTVHDFVPEKYWRTLSVKSLLRHKIFPLKRLLKICSGVLVPSLCIANEFSAFSNLPKVVTYEGADLSAKMAEPEFARRLLAKPFFLMISPLDPRKRISLVYEAAKKFPSVNFIIAGIKDGDNRFRSVWNKKTQNVILLPEFSESEKKWLLKHSVALLALSKYEGFDLPVLEAVQLKRPVILSSIPVHQELYKGAVLVESKDDLFAAIYSVLNGNGKVPKPRGKYTWRLAANRALLFFLRVLGNKNR